MGKGRSISELPERLVPPSFEEAYSVQAHIEKPNNLMVAEPEFVSVFNTLIEPRAQAYTRAEGMELVSELKLGLEFPNSHYMKFETAGELSLIADNACAHQFILGPTASEIWRDLLLPEHKIIGWISSKLKYEGIGSNVLGGPINALLWFLNEA